MFKESSKNTVPHATQTEFIYSIHSKGLKTLLKAKGSQSNSAIILQVVQQGAKLIPGCRTHQAGSWLAGRLSARKLACIWYIYLHLGYFLMVNAGKYTIHGCYGYRRCILKMIPMMMNKNSLAFT